MSWQRYIKPADFRVVLLVGTWRLHGHKHMWVPPSGQIDQPSILRDLKSHDHR
jgi:hypothetical protein